MSDVRIRARLLNVESFLVASCGFAYGDTTVSQRARILTEKPSGSNGDRGGYREPAGSLTFQSRSNNPTESPVVTPVATIWPLIGSRALAREPASPLFPHSPFSPPISLGTPANSPNPRRHPHRRRCYCHHRHPHAHLAPWLTSMSG